MEPILSNKFFFNILSSYGLSIFFQTVFLYQIKIIIMKKKKKKNKLDRIDYIYFIHQECADNSVEIIRILPITILKSTSPTYYIYLLTLSGLSYSARSTSDIFIAWLRGELLDAGSFFSLPSPLSILSQRWNPFSC